jgi:hypothetical protein
MQLASLLAIVVLAVGHAIAVPANVANSNVVAGPVGVANLGGSNEAAKDLAGSNLGAVVVRANKANRVGRRKVKSQPEYIASPQTSTDGSCTGESISPITFDSSDRSLQWARLNAARACTRLKISPVRV